MKIFIGSSTEQRDRVREIAAWIEDAGHEALNWDRPDLFLPGENTNTKLLEVSKIVEAAVFIFAEDDHIWYRQDALRQHRDNVLFEYGLFCGSIGFRKCIICRRGEPKTASDLVGLTFLDISDQRKNDARLRFLHWVRTISLQEADPAISDLMEQRAILKNQVEVLREQLDFEKSATADLKQVLRRNWPETSREWRLLFDFRFHRLLVAIIWTSYSTPGEWSRWLQENEFKQLYDMINWDQLINPSRGKWFIAKTLNTIRTYDFGHTYETLLRRLPTDVRSKVMSASESIADPDEIIGGAQKT